MGRVIGGSCFIYRKIPLVAKKVAAEKVGKALQAVATLRCNM